MRHAARIVPVLILAGTAALAQRGRGMMPNPQEFPMTPPVQSQGPVVQLKAETRVVEIDVTARGGNDQPASGLKQTDFTLYVDGHPQPFTIFSFNPGTAFELTAATAASTAPAEPNHAYSNRGAAPRLEAQHSAVILIDAYNGWFENFSNARKAVLGALNQLPADERIALYVIDRYKGLLQLVDYTTDRARLRTAVTKFTPAGTCAAPPGTETVGEATQVIANLGPPPPETADYWNSSDNAAEAEHYKAAFNQSPCAGADRARLAVMRDGAESVRQALVALAASLEGVPGRKSVFWVTEGFPPDLLQDTYICNCAQEWKTAFDKLNDANVAVNALDSNGIAGPPRLWGPGGVLSMQRVSATTGGQTFYQNADLAAALTRGIDDNRSSYTLGFYLKNLDGKYHTLKVVVDRPGVTLNYRAGYYAIGDAQRAAANKKIDLRTALANPAGEDGVGITAWAQPEGVTLDLTVNLDPATLTVRQQGSNWEGEVDELIVERDTDGRELGRESDVKRFEMSTSVRQEIERDGLNLKRSLRLVPGAAALEIVERDHASGRIGSLTVPLPPAPAPATPAGK